LFADAPTAESFARQLASDYYGCGILPDEGQFETPRLKGDVIRETNYLEISWTLQANEPGQENGDTYFLIVQPVAYHSAALQLDFWNMA
jgi:hypothetical protein